MAVGVTTLNIYLDEAVNAMRCYWLRKKEKENLHKSSNEKKKCPSVAIWMEIGNGGWIYLYLFGINAIDAIEWDIIGYSI